MFVLRKQFSTKHRYPLQNRLRLRDQLFPVLALRIGRVRHKHPIVRRILISSDVQLAVQKIAAVEKFFAGGDLDRRRARFQILKIHLALAPTLEDGNQQPAIVF